MHFLIASIDWLNEWVGRFFSWAIIIATVVVVYDVFLRYVLGSPTLWALDVTKQLYALHFMIVAGYGVLHESHVSVDFLYQKCSSRVQAGLELVGYLVFFLPFCFVLMVWGYRFALRSWQAGETTWSAVAIPIYPVKTVIAVAGVLLFLQGLSRILKRLLYLLGYEKPAYHP